MGKAQKPGWTFIISIVIQLFFASVQLLATSESAFHKHGVDPNYASLLKECKKIKLPNGTMIQTVPKLLQTPSITACSGGKSKYGPPLTQAVCRFPDCHSNPCQNGRCEETLHGYQCLCFPGFQGKHCAETSSTSDTATTTPSYSTLPATLSKATSAPTATTASPTSDTATTTPSHSTLPATLSKATSALPATGSSAKMFITDAAADVIFVSELEEELSFTSIPSTSRPYYVQYDPVERYIYWSETDSRCVYRSNVNGTGRKRVTTAGTGELGTPTGIAIAEGSRRLYISYHFAHKVTSMSIAHSNPLPGTQTDLVNQDITSPRGLVLDEQEGYIYIARRYGIVRALLHATNDIEEIYHNPSFSHLTGLSIDLTRNPRRIFFSDWDKRRTFYKDLSPTPSSDKPNAVELTHYIENSSNVVFSDMKYFDGVLYWIQTNDPTGIHGIGIMKDYDQANRSYTFQEVSQFQYPERFIITFVEP